jgi:iron complex outermembrane receptor protein
MKSNAPLRRKELAATISLLLAAHSAAWAQDQAAADQTEEMVMEEVVVTGKFRASLIDAIGTKRGSDTIVDAISAEDIGKLPDSSIAESLARLPGVAGERRNGRVSGISVRGFNENYVGTTLNGRELLGMGDNRGVEYDLYPSEIVSGIVVYKTPDATQMVQGIGGTIDIRTNRPLDTPSVLAVNATYEQNDLESANPDFDDNGHRLALSWSDTFADDTMGLSFAVATTESPSQEEQFRAWGDGNYPTADPSKAGPGVTLNGDEFILGGQDSFVRSATLERDTLSGVFQWAPSDDLTLTFDALYIDFQEDKVFRGFEEGYTAWGANDYVVTSADPGFVTGVDDNGGFKTVIRNDAERKEAELKTFGLNLDWQLSDQWKLVFDGAYSEVEKTITNAESYSGVGRANLLTQGPPTTRSFVMIPGGPPMFGPNPNGGTLDLTDFDLIRLAGPQAWGGSMAPLEQFQEVTLPDGSVIGPPQAQDGFINQPEFDEDLTSLRLEAAWQIDRAFMRQAVFGVNYSDRSYSKFNQGYFLTAPTWPNDGPIPEEYRIGTASLAFLGIPGVVAYDSLAMFDDGFYIASDANALQNDRLGDTYTVDEELLTAYARLDFDVDLGNHMLYGNVGLQYVDTDQTSSGFGTQTGPDRFVQATPIIDGDSYSDWLPSLNLNYDFNNGHLLRAAASKTISRPRMDDMRSNQQVSFAFNINNVTATDPNFGPWSASAGNAKLKPLEANQFDAAWDWYFADDGLLSVAYFYKDLTNWHRAGRIIGDFSEFYIPGYHQVVDDDGNIVTPAIFDGVVNFREDGLTGEVKGWELQAVFPFRLLWDPLDGLGAIATATFIDGELDDGTRVPGLSDENYSLTLFYTIGGFEFRVAGTKRSSYLSEVRGLSLALVPTVDQGAELWDAQISYDFGRAGFDGWLGGLSLALQGQNITDETTLITGQADARLVERYQRFGANYLLTAIYKFW